MSVSGPGRAEGKVKPDAVVPCVPLQFARSFVKHEYLGRGEGAGEPAVAVEGAGVRGERRSLGFGPWVEEDFSGGWVIQWES